MSKLIIPIHYHESGFSPVGPRESGGGSLQIDMANELTGFEVHKAFTTDDREYLKITGDIDLASTFTNNGQQALIIVSDELLSSVTNKLYLYKSTTSDFTSPVLKSPQAVYGDGEITASYFQAGTAISGKTKSLITYLPDTSYNYYRITVTPVSNQRMQIITHGIVYELPDNFRLSTRDYGYKYNNSSVKINLVGNIYYDGMQNNAVKRTHELSYEFLSDTDMNNLLSYFQLGKGGLPLWFIEDENDNSTWMMVGIESMKVKEPQVNYFSVTLNLVEY